MAERGEIRARQVGEGRRSQVHNGEIESEKKKEGRVHQRKGVEKKEMEETRAKKGSSGEVGTAERLAEWLLMWFLARASAVQDGFVQMSNRLCWR